MIANKHVYSTIWEGEITGTSTADHRRVVTALKNISEGKDLEKYLDVDNVLKYMAVHAFAVNMDSLSGSMAHNYYLYEYKGQLNLFPWDYNLSFGGMSMGSSGDATEMVNDAIDTPFSGTNFFDALLENEEYRERYHQYLQQLVDEYIGGGRFDEVYNRIRNQIDSLVETDPTAFYGYDEYLTAADMLHQTIMLRAESIEGQLDGTIPSTDSGQKADFSKLVDASAIDVKAMGQFSMGGFSDNVKGRKRSSTDESSSDSSSASGSGSTSDSGDVSNPSGNSGSGDTSNPSGNSGENGRGFGGKMPDGNMFSPDNMPSAGKFGMGNMPGIGGSKTSAKNLLTLGICFVVMLAALIFVSVFKRRRFTKK